MSICKAQFTWTAPMRQRNECPANRYVFTSRLNCSESTAGSRKTQNGADSTYSEEIGEKSVYFSRYGLVAAQRRIWMASRVAAECRLPLIQTLLISGRLCMFTRSVLRSVGSSSIGACIQSNFVDTPNAASAARHAAIAKSWNIRP